MMIERAERFIGPFVRLRKIATITVQACQFGQRIGLTPTVLDVATDLQRFLQPSE